MTYSAKNNSRLYFIQILTGLAVLVNFSGLFVTILGPDGILYASIAKTMVQHNNFIELFNGTKDWLDKPHFPFWITALSFKLFGYHTWAYKLPAILFLLMGAWYTYLLGKRLYNKQVGQLAAFILLTAQHIVISNNDVRAEPYLTGLLIAGIYHFYRSTHTKIFIHVLSGSFFTACAVMTKGIFILIPVALAIIGYLWSQKNFRQLFNFKWLVAGGLILLFILPELYCLYYQFDMHPEKWVFGQTHVSGIRFFFWDSQFGRFFNTGPIKGEGDYTFFFHTLLWAFLPWSVLLYTAVVSLFFNRNIPKVLPNEWLTVWAAGSTFVLFTLSSFQLPHYTNIIFPFFAILTAAHIIRNQQDNWKHIRLIQVFICLLAVFALVLLHVSYDPGKSGITFVVLLVLAAGFILWVLKDKLYYPVVRWIYVSGITSMLISVYLNIIFYPSLLKYQSGSEAAFYCNEHYPGLSVYSYHSPADYEMDFYLEQPLEKIASDTCLKTLKRPALVYLPDSSVASLRKDSIRFNLIQEYDYFSVSRLNLAFLRSSTRKTVVQRHLLISLP